MKKFIDAFLRYKNRIQNVCIFILCFTVLIEVSHLWFVNLANGQSVYNRSNKSIAQSTFKKEFIAPYRILKGDGYNNFYVAYEGESYSEILSICEKVLSDSSSKSNFIETSTDISSILDNENILIFDYSYKIDDKMLLEALNAKKNNFNKIDSFDKICFVLAENNIKLYFINSELNESYNYELKKNNLYNELLQASKKMITDVTYSYNLDKNISIFENELIANINTELYYNKINAKNPFTTVYGDSPRNLVESKVDKYFKNILYMKFSPNDTAYIFSDTDTVVKYFNNGIFEYSYYNVSPNSYEYSIVEDYSIARSFIEDDEDVINTYYLKNYYRNNFETVFEFTYVANNFPIQYESENGYNNPSISVTVKNNVVTNYKKIVHNFYVSETLETATKPLETAINVFASSQEKAIKNVNIGYKATDSFEEMTLYWFMNAFDSEMSLATH